MKNATTTDITASKTLLARAEDFTPARLRTVMIPAIQQFLNSPNDIDGLTKNIEAQKKTIFATD